MPIGKLARRDHDGVLAPIAAEPQTLAQALDHGEVRLLPGVVGRCRGAKRMPASLPRFAPAVKPLGLVCRLAAQALSVGVKAGVDAHG